MGSSGAQVQEVVRMACLLRWVGAADGGGFRSRTSCAWRVSFGGSGRLMAEGSGPGRGAHGMSPSAGSAMVGGWASGPGRRTHGVSPSEAVAVRAQVRQVAGAQVQEVVRISLLLPRERAASCDGSQALSVAGILPEMFKFVPNNSRIRCRRPTIRPGAGMRRGCLAHGRCR
jgi:hypothetical protein